ncbi:cytochrome-c peroxidase [Solitalea canadensis]|uniref:Cytochrome c peroxidase n=1 Tax=Solitalea canadensis (strain ATCC 29591 / DSM 3403 / JCM 21819 / LMG 8368 / NBRC 15130 / NCIMB 12057 / USAM 9D) TaxID=929556 RepID=H8KN78_SOLCM|nr:cytochrome c peroxidase [Solitalea canadensis]AFD09411.1 cytochrome c peroxidase [Solitalea canadensis DSM 3403]
MKHPIISKIVGVNWLKLFFLGTILSFILFSALAADDYKPTLYNLTYPSYFGNRFSIPSDNPLTNEGIYLGRKLFYETRLSANRKISCASCHKQEKAFSDDRVGSIGVDGSVTERNSMAIVNLLWARKFFWDGRAIGLEQQAAIPLANPHEMGQSAALSAVILRKIKGYPYLFKHAFGDTAITADRIVKAIAQFERTLISADSPYDKYLRNEYSPSQIELEGMGLFMTAPQPGKGIRGANCAHCHGGEKSYLEMFHNNGLDSIYKDAGIQLLTGFETDHGRFKAPTLRNIALTAPYMHDGRFSSLEKVLDHYNGPLHPHHLSSFLKGSSNNEGGLTLGLTNKEKMAIVSFLHMLTDSSFVKNPAFSDPNKETN